MAASPGRDLEARPKFSVSSGIIKRDEEITFSLLKLGIHSHSPHRSWGGIKKKKKSDHIVALNTL